MQGSADAIQQEKEKLTKGEVVLIRRAHRAEWFLIYVNGWVSDET
jgi:hypothetical protein